MGFIINNSEELNRMDFESVPIDTFWNVGDETELKMHRIHSYPAKFPAFITTKAIEYAKLKKNSPTWIADCFCGCGTVALEAKRNNINFWGCDINPVATMIAKTKSYSYSETMLDEYFKLIKENYTKSSDKLSLKKKAKLRIKYWFKSDQIINLTKLKKSIYKSVPKNSIYRKFFLCAFSNILKPASKWLAKSIKPQIDPKKKQISALKLFKIQCKKMFLANKENNLIYNTKSVILTRNALKLKTISNKADLIITSPPYVTSYEYADLHQLSTLWLNYVDDYRDLRARTIGSARHNVTFEDETSTLNSIGKKIILKLFDKDKSKAKLVAKYFNDMQKVASNSINFLNKNGLALFVIGNTEYKNVRIDNAKHLSMALLNAGYKNLDITKRKIVNKTLTPYRDEIGCFTKDKTCRKIYNEEFIIIGRKNG